MDNIILDINQIHHSFAEQFIGISGKKEVEQSEILKGVTVQIKRGTVTALIGGNGSGKSTLFNIISGLLKPNKGSVKYHHNENSYELTSLPGYKHAQYGIARLFQSSNVFADLTVIENLLVSDDQRSGEQPWHILTMRRKVKDTESLRQKEAFTILQQLLGEDNPLWKKRGEKAGNLSIGQQRLLAFARLLMNQQAELFLLDEPCAGVNDLIKKSMSRLIQNLREQGKTILLIEHNMNFALETAQEALYLEDGKILLEGDIQTVVQSQIVQHNYLGVEQFKHA